MSVIGAGRWPWLDRYWAGSPSSTACSPPPTNRPNIISFSAMSPAAPRGPLVRRASTRLREPRPSSRRPGRDLHQSGPPPALWSCLAMSRATLPGSLWTPYLLLSAATAAASVGELDEEPCEATRRDDLQQLGAAAVMLRALRAGPDGRPPVSVTGSRRVALFRWRQRPGRTALRAGHRVCCEAVRSPPPG